MITAEQLAAAGLATYADDLLALGCHCARLNPAARRPSHPPRLAATATRFSLDAVAIASSGTHWLALPTGGAPVAWGYNDRGQLGNATRAESKEPVAAKKLDDVVAVATGARHSLALRADSTVVAWGDNEYGQLGDATRKLRNKPTAVLGLNNVRAIAAGDTVSYALRADGSVVGWGMNVGPDYFGRDAIPDHPVTVRGIEREVVALAAGRSTAVALTDTGEVLLWGVVMLRDGSVAFQAPEAVAGLDARVVAIAAGNSHSLALTDDGRVLAWGDSSLGALGVHPDAVPDSGIVEVIDGNMVAIAAAFGASIALTTGGEILRWGAIAGSGMPILKQPTRVDFGPRDSDIVAIAAEAALTANGDVHWWHSARDHGVDGASQGAKSAHGGSRLGGIPDLAVGTQWPQVDERPLAFIVQLDLAELAAVGCDPPFPADGLLSLFVLPADIGFANTFALRYAPAGTQLASAQPPAALADGDRFAALALRPARELSLPPPTAAAVQRLGLSDADTAAYAEIVTHSDQPLHRVLGHPALLQTPDPRDEDPDLTLLLQVDSEDGNAMYWGDCGRLYIWIGASDLAALRFEQATMLFDQ